MQPELRLEETLAKEPRGTAVRGYRYSKELPQGNGRSKGQGFPYFLSSHFLILARRSRRPDSNWDSMKQQRATDGLTLSYQEQPVSFELPQKNVPLSTKC